MSLDRPLPSLPRSLARAVVPIALTALLVVSFARAHARDDLDLDPEDPRVLVQIGSYEDAADIWRARLEKEPADMVSARGLAECLVATGSYGEALSALDAALVAGGADAARREGASAVHAGRGRILLMTGRLKDAETAFRAALEIDSSNVEALNRLGEALKGMGRVADAEATWNSVIDVYRGLSVEQAEKLSADSFVEMGLALIHLNRWRDADEVMFPQAEEQDAKCLQLFLEWGRAMQSKYNYPDARSFFRDAFTENPNFADARVAMAENYLLDFQVGTRRYELAESQIRKALEVNPRHPGAFLAQGSLWLTDGNIPEAVRNFREALAVNPASQRARGLLAACHFLDREMDEFRAVEKVVLDLNPQAGEFYHTIAEAIERRFRYKDAAKFSEKALAVEEGYWPAYHTLAINLLRTGDEERGRFYLEKSWEKDPYNVWVLNTKKLLRHMDRNHRVLKQGDFIYKFPKDDYDVYVRYLVPVIEDAYAKLPAHYQTELEPPLQIEVFTDHKWFSARLVGLEGVPAAGACFGNLVILSSPKALPQNWGAVAWHEFAHVVTLHATKHRIPRWFTEGLSVYEEGRDHPAWARSFEREIADAYGSGRLLGIDELDFGFTKPKYPGQVLMSYYQGCLIVEYVIEKWGFDKIRAMIAGYEANKPTPQIFREVFEMSTADFDAGFFAWLGAWVDANGYQPALAEEVIERLQIELEETPEDVSKLVRLAWAYRSNGNEIDAPLSAGKALKLDPENGDAEAILGFCALDKGRTKTALEHLERAIEKGTRFRFRVCAALGGLAEKSDEKEKALAWYEKAKEASPRAGAGNPKGANLYYKLAELYDALGREDDALRTLEEVRRFSSEDPRCRLRLAEHHLQQEGAEAARAAVELLDEVIYINPFDRKVHEQLAAASVTAGAHEITIRQYEFLLEWARDFNPRTAHRALARAYLATGQKEKAARSAQRVLDFDEEDAEAREILEKAAS